MFADNLIKSMKNKSDGWYDLAAALFGLNQETIEPLLERAKALPSIFSLKKEDLNIRLNELGEYFALGKYADVDKPLIIQQRIDEIKQKGYLYPLTRTMAREFGDVEITWQPLFSPVDSKYEYGKYLSTKEEASDWLIEEWFLTSRGIITIPINQVSSGAATLEEAELKVRKFEEDLFRVIPPLIPTNIVFDGHRYVIRLSVAEVIDIAGPTKSSVTQLFDKIPDALAEKYRPIIGDKNSSDVGLTMADGGEVVTFFDTEREDFGRVEMPQQYRAGALPSDIWPFDKPLPY